MWIRTTIIWNNKGNSNILLKARATTLIEYKITATIFEKKVHCSQVSNGNIYRLDESFYLSNIERLLHLSPDGRLQNWTRKTRNHIKQRHESQSSNFWSFSRLSTSSSTWKISRSYKIRWQIPLFTEHMED